MAIKIAGTTVINDSRELSNIASVDATTVAALGAAGVGGGGLEATASGSISDGDPLVINSDGTLSSVSGSSLTQFASTTVTLAKKPVYDPDNQKVVFFYHDPSANIYAVVGTVSGASITFGSPQSVGVTGSQLSASYDTVNNKYLLFYKDSSQSYGRAIVCTLTGSTFSFGTPYTFRSSTTYKFDSTFDVTNGKVVFVYQGGVNDSFGYARVATISGTSVSVGSEYLLQSGSNTNHPSCIYDPVSTNIIIGYEDVNDAQQSATLVGTVSGTSISAPTTTRTRHGGSQVKGTYLNIDTNANRIVFSSLNQSGLLYSGIGTVSGGKLTLPYTSYNFSTGTSDSSRVSLAYDQNINKMIVFYPSSSTSISLRSAPSSTTYVVWSNEAVFGSNPGGLSADYSPVSGSVVLMAYIADTDGKGASIKGGALSNVSADNFVGFSDGNYTDGQTATCQLSGSVDDSQSGLTIGQGYFVQLDGSLDTTAGDPSVRAGLAVAATKIIVKG